MIAQADTPLDALDPQRPTLTEQAIGVLRAAILDGRLAPGELWSVGRLADRLGVSRTPVREALLHLERQGLVRFERNRGVRVLESSVHDLDDVLGLRLLLEVPAARHAAERADDALPDALAAELAAMAQRAAAGDQAGFMAHDKAFHERLLGAAGNRRLVGVVGGLRDVVRGRGASTVGRGRDLRVILAEHERILDALRAGDAEAVAAAMREHLVETRRLLLDGDGDVDGAAGLPWAAR